MPQPNQKVEVVLDEATRKDLENLVRSGKARARQVRWARVLLLADADQREGRIPTGTSLSRQESLHARWFASGRCLSAKESAHRTGGRDGRMRAFPRCSMAGRKLNS